MPPLKGVIHSAMVLSDASIAQITTESIHQVFGPKILGCLNLHEQTRKFPLDFFVLFSSISSSIGNPGQACYAAANGFLDRFSHYRRGLGLPALTVNWGALNTGILARDAKVANHLNRSGIKAMEVKTALSLLEEALIRDEHQIGVWDINWSQLNQALPSLTKSRPFSDFYEKSDVSENHFRNGLLALSETERLEFIINHLKASIAQTLKMDASQIDPSVRLSALGVDSLMAMELQASLETTLGVKIPTVELMKGPSITQLANFVSSRVSFC
jgi:acyl carrier protein